MSAPDELRQLADRYEARATEAEERAAAELLDPWHEDRTNPLRGDAEGHAQEHLDEAADRRAAAVALRHHANLVDAIGDPDDLRLWADALDRLGLPFHRRDATRLRRIAAAVSPSPAPTTCPTCGSDTPGVRRDLCNPMYAGRRPDSWHQAAT